MQFAQHTATRTPGSRKPGIDDERFVERGKRRFRLAQTPITLAASQPKIGPARLHFQPPYQRARGRNPLAHCLVAQPQTDPVFGLIRLDFQNFGKQADRLRPLFETKFCQCQIGQHRRTSGRVSQGIQKCLARLWQAARFEMPDAIEKMLPRQLKMIAHGMGS